MNAPPDEPASLPALERLDARIDALGPRRSLDPAGRTATSLVALAKLAPKRLEVHRSLAAVAEAQLENFPGNLFWDLDALAAHLDALPEAELARSTEKLVLLQRLFGTASSIRFQYAHDFIYGYDWTKWVRHRGGDKASGPYSAPFLDYSLRRGNELLALIEADDKKYPKLEDGSLRNPFGFRRTPLAEAQLFQALAAAGLIPLKAWERHPPYAHDVDFHAERESYAARLCGPRDAQ